MRQIKDGVRRHVGQPERPVPPSLLRGIGLLVLSGLLCATAGAAKAGEPLLLVTQTEIDLGDIPKGLYAEARFELRNAGTADLRVLEVKSGCACTVATYDEVIPPGGVGQLTATLSTETLNGMVGQGISLITNDPTSPTTALVIRAKIVTAVRILPEAPLVLRNRAGEPPVRRVIRRSLSAGHGFFAIAGLRASAPWIDARARKVREPLPASDGLPAVTPGDWILELRLDGQPTYGRRRERVEFKTGLERQPLVRLVVQTELLAPVQLAVERLFLQASGDNAEETLSFTVREGLDRSTLVVQALPDGLTVQVEPGDGQALTARVRWPGGKLDQGRLIFTIADEQVELPVRYEPLR